jgi:hypothetical protein
MSTHSTYTDISDCGTSQEMARWLLRCPLAVLQADQGYIRRWLQAAGFRDGLSYLDIILSVLREERREDGNFAHMMAFASANGRLWRVADGLEPR